jgi:hypothetical protein
MRQLGVGLFGRRLQARRSEDMPKAVSFGRRNRLGLSFLALVFFVTGISAAGRARPQQPKVRVKKKPKYISAGRGQEPWDVTRHLIPLREIQSGGPPKDGIPALTNPAFVSANEANRLLRPSDIVLGVEFGGVAKAYPVRILNWHEIVNDDVGQQPVLVSW